VPVASLLKLPQWDAATRHPFLRAVGEGTASTFGVWLAQDALFVADLVAFQARLVARAPRSAQGVLAQGVVGLVAELDWFDIQAASLGVSLEVAPMRATRDYQALLSGLDEERYARAVVGLWVLERVSGGLALRRVVRWGGAVRRGGGALDRPRVRVVCGSA
jgi:formylaminopyrimidine deformylase / aminopyrimidine aminohydrolase